MNKMKLVTVTVLSALLITTLLGAVSKKSSVDDNMITLNDKNTVVLDGEVGGEETTKAITKAMALDQPTKIESVKKHLGLKNDEPLYLFMNTPGGSIKAGLEFLEAFKGLHHPVKTISLFSASMGFQIVQGLGERLVLENGILMSHRAYGGLEGQIGGQSPSQFENRYNLWYDIMQRLDNQTVKRTNGKQTLESYQKAYASELWRVGAKSVEEGYADRVVSVRCDDTLQGVETHHILFFGFNIYYDMDKCPLNTGITNIRVERPGRSGGRRGDEGEEDKKKGKEQEKEKPKKADVEDSMSSERAEEIKVKFVEYYNHKMRTPIIPYW